MRTMPDEKLDEELQIGKKVFCANCGHSFDDNLEACPHCNSKKHMKKSVLWCDKE